MSRDSLHQLIDRLPEAEVPAAVRYLEYLNTSPAYRAMLGAPVDDEPVTDEEAAAIRRGLQDLKNGRVVSHEELLREFGLE